MYLTFEINKDDFVKAGQASSNVKKILKQLGFDPAIIKRTVIAMYEAEINAVIHGGGGIAEVTIEENKIIIKIKDEGPGISDLNLAMTEGFSTASDKIRELGFGAGMGLPNIKRHASEMKINTTLGKGTEIIIIMYV